MYKYTERAVKERLKKKYIIQVVLLLVRLYIGRTTGVRKDSIQLTKIVYYYKVKQIGYLKEGNNTVNCTQSNKNGCIT